MVKGPILCTINYIHIRDAKDINVIIIMKPAVINERIWPGNKYLLFLFC